MHETWTHGAPGVAGHHCGCAPTVLHSEEAPPKLLIIHVGLCRWLVIAFALWTMTMNCRWLLYFPCHHFVRCAATT